MSARVNDFSTWGYMVPAGPGDFRPAQEPLSEPTWALCTSTWALQTEAHSLQSTGIDGAAGHGSTGQFH